MGAAELRVPLGPEAGQIARGWVSPLLVGSRIQESDIKLMAIDVSRLQIRYKLADTKGDLAATLTALFDPASQEVTVRVSVRAPEAAKGVLSSSGQHPLVAVVHEAASWVRAAGGLAERAVSVGFGLVWALLGVLVLT